MPIKNAKVYPILAGTITGASANSFTTNYCEIDLYERSENTNIMAILQFNIPLEATVDDVVIELSEMQKQTSMSPMIGFGHITKKFVAGSTAVSYADDYTADAARRTISSCPTTETLGGYKPEWLNNGLLAVSHAYLQYGGYIKIDPSNSYAEITYTVPEITDFEVVGTSIDSDITCKWTAEDVVQWTIQVIKDNAVVATRTGTTETSCTFARGSFVVGGEYTFRISSTRTGTTVTEEAKVNLTYTQADIRLIELPGQSINVDAPFTITWVADNQSSFEIVVAGIRYTGTTQTSITIPKDIVPKGTQTVTLTVTYSGTYYSNTDTATTTFTAYGAPKAPILNTKSGYNTATPSLAWSSDEQVAYHLVLKRGTEVIEDTGEVVSAHKYHVTTALENGVTYNLSLKISNKYGLWSKESTTSFIVQFNIPNPPHIQALADIVTGSIIVNVSTDTSADTEYKNTEIWKREPAGEWKRMAYKLDAVDAWQDFYVAGGIEYEYKARNIGLSGGISESDIISASTIVKNYSFYDVEKRNNRLLFETGDAPKPKINQNVVTNLFAGANAPMNFSDGVLYWTCTMRFTTDDRADIAKIVELMRAKLLLYKDNKGHKWFGNITNSPEFPEDDVDIISIQIEFTQSQFAEEDVYCGDNLTLIRWNGGWKFDGTHTYGGE